MAFTMNCPHCGCLVSASDLPGGQTYAGKKGRCLSCAGVVDLGTAAQADSYDLQEVIGKVAAPEGPLPTPAGAAPAFTSSTSAPAVSAPPRVEPVERVEPAVPVERVVPAVPAVPKVPVVPKAPKAQIIHEEPELILQDVDGGAPPPPPKKRFSTTMIVVLGLLFLMCGGGLAAGAYFLWPMISNMRGAVNVASGEVILRVIVAAESKHFITHKEYAQTLADLKDELGANADQIIALEAPGGENASIPYVYRILKTQGASAPGGAKNYVDAAGKMTQGCAVLAYPVDISKPRNKIFIGNVNGSVHALEVAPTLADEVKRLDMYDPNAYWRKLP